jgi:hypothetical protein
LQLPSQFPFGARGARGARLVVQHVMISGSQLKLGATLEKIEEINLCLIYV